MATFNTSEEGFWLDIDCVTCKQGVRAPVSPYGHLLIDHFERTHNCQVQP